MSEEEQIQTAKKVTGGSHDEDDGEIANKQVADFYNKKVKIDLETRSKSRIYYMRNFNNWIKSVLINEFTSRLCDENKSSGQLRVLDLGCGRGGDIRKWIKAHVTRVTFADLAQNSLDECKSRCDEMRHHFRREFIQLDATKQSIVEKISSQELVEHDLVSSQFVIHYSFESYEQANCFLKNVSDCLRTGGYFIGSTTNANELVRRLRESDTNEFGNEIYKVKFYQTDKEHFDLFGVKLDFYLENVVECPEYMLNFKCLTMLAEKHKLKLVMVKTFNEFFNEFAKVDKYADLLGYMKALKTYKLDDSDEPCDNDNDDYAHFEQKIKSGQIKREDLGRNQTYATLSKSEWEVISLYKVFAFVKE